MTHLLVRSASARCEIVAAIDFRATGSLWRTWRHGRKAILMAAERLKLG